MKEYLDYFIVYLIVMWGVLPIVAHMYSVIARCINSSYRGDGYIQCVLGWHFAAIVIAMLLAVLTGIVQMLDWYFSTVS